MPRFYAPDVTRSGDVVSLPDEEAEHLTRVLRLRAGEQIVLFDGRGGEFDATIERATKSGVIVRVAAARQPSAREPRVAVTLAQAVLKGDKMDDVVRDAVMMGVAELQPLVTVRSEVTLASLARGHRRPRWQRIAISSAKQCGRAVVPPVREPVEFRSLVWRPPAGATERRVMFVEPSASASAHGVASLNGASPGAALVLVGPEGGWTCEEIERGSGTCELLTLGSRTLRADAMPLVALSALFTVWKEF
jgi:16S rRNA (uracil1498-N3)-methyltransferase